ncbi:MAG: phage holin family protein [Oscillospiraceae bacterium]|nr:phage holin family protein [Oscillospiraceae bacterium]
MKRLINAIIMGTGGITGFLFGELDGFFYALIAFVILDYITGVIAAVIQKNLRSEIGFKGICKKITIFIVVAVANIIDSQIIQNGSALRTAAIFLFISNEGISLLENAGGIGLPIPKKLFDVLSQLKQKSNEEEIDNEKSQY